MNSGEIKMSSPVTMPSHPNQVNGVLNNLPLNLNDGEVVVYQEGKHYTLKTKFGLVVTYDLVYHVTVTVPGNYRGKTCGLCGDFNGKRNDEYRLPNGRLSRDVNAFGAAWKVAIPGVVCDDGCSGNKCPKCNPKQKAIFQKPTYCGILTDPKGPFAACHAKLKPAPYFADCIFDICTSNGDRKVLCDSAASYALNCHIAGIDVKGWRSPSFCRKRRAVCPYTVYPLARGRGRGRGRGGPSQDHSELTNHSRSPK